MEGDDEYYGNYFPKLKSKKIINLSFLILISGVAQSQILDNFNSLNLKDNWKARSGYTLTVRKAHPSEHNIDKKILGI